MLTLTIVLVLVLVGAGATGALGVRRSRARAARASAPRSLPPPGHAKVVVFYSSIGAGHVSAARAIQQEIQQQDPQSVVVLQDIRAFMSPIRRRIDERLYWFVANHLPESFEALFWSMQEEGNAAASLARLPNDYPEERVLAFIQAEMPQTVLATHYGSAQVLGRMRERGLLRDVKLAWLHTDYFEGYLPRISKRIDRTFLAHPELAARWVAAGVPLDLVDTTGMPVNVPPATEGTRRRTLGGLGLEPAAPTVVIAGGKEGAGDYVGVIRSLAAVARGPVQVIALCGTNARIIDALERAAPPLAPRITVRPLGLVPQERVVALMRSADVLVTKAGGLTPTEAFSIGVPTVLLEVVTGHERENAEFFGRLGLAAIAPDAGHAGPAVAQLLSSKEQRVAMLAEQARFRESFNAERIARFALDPTLAPGTVPAGFGTEHGAPADDVDGTLNELEAAVPADLELLLSYSTSKVPERIARENPFGHLAIRVGATVFSANHMAERGGGATLLQHVSLSEYLFGVTPPAGRQEHTSTYGMAYGRDTIGLRVLGVPAQACAAMGAEADRIEAEFRDGTLRWDRRHFNCADAVERILSAGGYAVAPRFAGHGAYRMPLDAFDRALCAFQEDPALRTELIGYRKLSASQASYRFSRFPLSLTQPLRSFARVVGDGSSDALESAITRQVSAFGGGRLLVEDLHPRRATSSFGAASAAPRASLERALLADASRLWSARAGLLRDGLQRVLDQRAICELRQVLDRGQEIARLATERAEELLVPRTAERLRSLFTALQHEYAALHRSVWPAAQLEAYLRDLQGFEELVALELSRFRGVRRWSILMVRHARRAARRTRRALWHGRAATAGKDLQAHGDGAGRAPGAAREPRSDLVPQRLEQVAVSPPDRCERGPREARLANRAALVTLLSLGCFLVALVSLPLTFQRTDRIAPRLAASIPLGLGAGAAFVAFAARTNLRGYRDEAGPVSTTRVEASQRLPGPPG